MQKRYDIVLAGLVAAGVTERVLRQEQKELSERFSRSFLKQARLSARFVESADVITAAAEEADFIQPVGAGGLFAALWKLGEQCGMGLVTGFDQIPIRQEFIEICQYADIDPYTADDAGSVLIAAEDAENIIAKIQAQDIPAGRIGFLQEDKARVIMRGDTRCYLNKPFAAKGEE